MAPKPIDNLLNAFRRKKVSPTETIGHPGVGVFGGYVDNGESNASLGTRSEQHKTYSEILANASIVAAGVRYFLNLVSKAEWSFVPSDADTSGEYAQRLYEMLTKDPDTPWHRIVRRAAMYRFYGFSLQEWTAKRREDGIITFQDIAPRAQLTINRWDMATDGSILGVIQTNPQNSQETYLPRGKLIYLVDDTLSDSPEGLGLFRHLVAPAQRLLRYEQLEGIGYEVDLKGIPIARVPIKELQKAVEAGEISQAQATAAQNVMKDFIENHVKTRKLGLLLDSMTYETKDEAGRPSNVPKWDLELLKGDSTSFADMARAIDRINRELARILGVEQLMLGDGQGGSYALSEDKTNSFFLLVDGALTEITEAVEKDIIDPIWTLNGWPDEMKPKASTEAVRHTDVQEVASALRDMATAGAVLDPRDPVVDEVRELMGVERRPQELLDDIEEEMSLLRDSTLQDPKPTGPGADPDEIEEDDDDE